MAYQEGVWNEAIARDGLWILRFNFAGEPAAGGKGTSDFGPNRMARVDDVLEDAVDGILIEDAEISVRVDIHFECLELKAFFVRHVVERDGAEIGQIGFGTDRRVFGNLNRDLVAFILIGKGFNSRQRSSNTTLRMPLVVAQLRRFLLSACRFTLHASRLMLSTVVSSNPSDRFFLIR